MPPISTTIPTQKPEPRALFFNWSNCSYSLPRFSSSWTMTMDSRPSQTMKINDDNNTHMKRKELSVQISRPPVSKVETLGHSDLQFDRLQLSEQELIPGHRFEFGQFVARQALLDEEFWTAAWLRAESHWESQTYERYIHNYKRKFAEQEFVAVKRRCKSQHGESCTCIITVMKEKKNVKHSILKGVVGTLDLSIRHFLQGETFPGEQVNAPLFCSIKRTPTSRYGYIANLCVATQARRQGIASNMLYFAVEAAKSNGATEIYVHVDKNNRAAQKLYQKMGFRMVDAANSRLLLEETYLLRLQT